MSKLPKYFIEAAAYEVPIGGKMLGNILRRLAFWKIVSLLPVHMFFVLSKRERNNQITRITTLHGLATEIGPDGQKRILDLGTQLKHKLVLYHLFNHRAYLAKIRNHSEQEESILQEKTEMMTSIALTTQEDEENAKAADDMLGGEGYGYLYWLPPNAGTRTVYGGVEGENDALKLWKVLNDFKEFYNQNPNNDPLCAFSAAFLRGDNAAFTTFAYLLGAPVNQLSPLWAPGLGGVLGVESFADQLELFRRQCEAIKEGQVDDKASTNEGNTANSTDNIAIPLRRGSIVTEGSLSGAEVVAAYGRTIFENSEYRNAAWDNSGVRPTSAGSTTRADPISRGGLYDDFAQTREEPNWDDTDDSDEGKSTISLFTDDGTSNGNGLR